MAAITTSAQRGASWHRAQKGGPTRVKAWLGDVGLVVPIKDPNEKVQELLKEIALRFEGYGIKTGSLRLAEVRTRDGCLLNVHDVIGDVLESGEAIEVVDFDDWVAAQENLCQQPIVTISRDDYSDPEAEPKFITLGLHEHNKLYVKFCTGYIRGSKKKTLGLELFDAEALKNFAKEGKLLLGSKTGDDGKWKIEAHFIVKGHDVEAVELSVQSATDPHPVIKRVNIKVGRTISIGDVTTIQEDGSDFDPKEYASKVPKDVSKGPTLPGPNANATAVSNDNTSTGDSPLQITQKGALYADSTPMRDGVWHNAIFARMRLLNNGNEVLAVVKATPEWKDAQGKWNAAPLRKGGRGGTYYFRSETEYSQKFGPKDSDDIEIAIGIPMNLPQWDYGVRKAHRSLPQPLHIRWTFEDSNGGKSTIEMQYVSEPVDMVTRQSREKYQGRPLAFFETVDDESFETRFYSEVLEKLDEGYISIVIGENSGTNKYLYPSEIKQLAYQAKMQNKSEIAIPGLTWEKQGCSINVLGLVDVEKARMYALKFDMKSTTSSKEAHYLLPRFPPSQ
eukprot:TRINITY_DN6965_c0_g1_i1.p1 TRINITY_DN6965_c0_g1~~TRINITY_DN6965_c0_g1_i1.p1  ORF type:complete len:570 (+),score=138.61 TRINITY_DN6965_c0_g1_i1:26-1711(+)